MMLPTPLVCWKNPLQCRRMKHQYRAQVARYSGEGERSRQVSGICRHDRLRPSRIMFGTMRNSPPAVGTKQSRRLPTIPRLQRQNPCPVRQAGLQQKVSGRALGRNTAGLPASFKPDSCVPDYCESKWQIAMKTRATCRQVCPTRKSVPMLFDQQPHPSEIVTCPVFRRFCGFDSLSLIAGTIASRRAARRLK